VTSGTEPRYTRFDATPDSTHERVVALVPRGARVLEFGCATGYMSEVLKSRLGCRVTGIEVSPEAAERARAHCARVIVGDAESLDFEALLEAPGFDVVLFADVLEHLQRPEDVLRRLRPHLAEGGSVVASIPNVAHGSVRLALLSGQFRYRDIGLLDDTHLRFFTRESVQDLFEGAGYVVTHWLRKRLPIDQTEIPLPRELPDGVLEWLADDPEATTYQFIVRAVRAEAAEMLRQVRAELVAARAELETIERVQAASREIAALVPAGSTFILVDEESWGAEAVITDRRRLPFLERDGEYFGPPPDSDTGIRELERLRKAGASFAVFAWPAFWWLEHYAELNRWIRSRFRCVAENDRIIAFDLRS
jgi:SAM-dependent methyltransferase